MNSNVKLIVMLTNNDKTVENANEIFESCKDLEVKCWGFKDVGLPIAEMKKLVKSMKEAHKKTVLEVVSLTEKEGMEGAKLAVECGFDYLMGTEFYESIANYLIDKDTKYFPFCGKVYGHPSILDGSVEEIINHAKDILKKGADGVDLLAYRYIEDADKRLIKDFLKQIEKPVVLAGSINSWDRLEKVLDYKPWGFTIGTAFFNNKFGANMTFREQLTIVLEKVKQFNLI